MDSVGRSDPVLLVPREVGTRYNARVLDPLSASRVAGQSVLQPTVYLGDRLLVGGGADGTTHEALAEAAHQTRLQVVTPEGHRARRAHLIAAARDAGHDDPESLVHTVHQLEPASRSAVAPDAWEVLQGF